jgi:hypothetical protein
MVKFNVAILLTIYTISYPNVAKTVGKTTKNYINFSKLPQKYVNLLKINKGNENQAKR